MDDNKFPKTKGIFTTRTEKITGNQKISFR